MSGPRPEPPEQTPGTTPWEWSDEHGAWVCEPIDESGPVSAEEGQAALEAVQRRDAEYAAMSSDELRLAAREATVSPETRSRWWFATGEMERRLHQRVLQAFGRGRRSRARDN